MNVRTNFLRIGMVVMSLSILANGHLISAAENETFRFEAASKLDQALKDIESIKSDEQQVAILKAAASDLQKNITANVVVTDLIQSMESPKTKDARKLVKEWRKTLTEARDILRFEIQEESPIPEGFPTPTPVGEIRVQQYPEYRLARTDVGTFEGGAFWTLFNHIKKQDIEMTAPVEMKYSADGDGSSKRTAMSFMYRNTRQGKLGSAGKVDVVDVPAEMAISIGIRGDTTKERVADAKRRLDRWLESHRDEYESAGPLRVMGYNSPFIADLRKYAEVQIPVIAKSKSKN